MSSSEIKLENLEARRFFDALYQVKIIDEYSQQGEADFDNTGDIQLSYTNGKPASDSVVVSASDEESAIGAAITVNNIKGRPYRLMNNGGGQWEYGVEDGGDSDYNDGFNIVTVSAVQAPVQCNAKSTAPVAYGSGHPDVTATDLTSSGLGLQWNITRSWSPDTLQALHGSNLTGNGWISGSDLRAVAYGTGIQIATDGLDAETFDLSGGTYTGDFGSTSTLTATGTGSSSRLVYQKADGTVYTFYSYDSSITANQQGRLDTVTDSYGTTITAHYSAGQLSYVQRSFGSGSTAVVETFTYAYGSSGGAAGRVTSISQTRSVGGGTDVPVRTAEYTYYSGLDQYGNPDANGRLGDLQLVTIHQGSITGAAISHNYYRYYNAAADTYTEGLDGGLRFAFDTAAYDRLIHSFTTPASVDDGTIANYATEYFEYDDSGHVKTEVAQGAGCSACSGGYGTFTFSYQQNTDPSYTAGFNNWYEKTIETLPDGSQNIVYTNTFGQPMLKVYSSGGHQWLDYYRYDSSGRQVLHANPSAVTGFDETKLDLVDMTDPVNFHATYLSDSSGLLDIFNYPTLTTATTSATGDVVGYLKSEQIRNGDSGTSIVVRAYSYIAHTVGSNTVYPVASETEYSNTGGTGARTTNFAYTWFSGTNRIATKVTSYPVVSTAENGSGSVISEATYYDPAGRAVWVVDGSGFITYNVYDQATGALLMQTRDVNTSTIAPSAMSVSGITSSGTTATATTAAANAFAVGQTVKIAGAAQSAYNGSFVVASVISQTQFTYVMASSPGTSATGTLTAQLATPVGGGLQLTTSMAVDDQGRVTKVTDPNGNVTCTVYNDVTHETRVYRGWNSTTKTTTGPVEVTRDDQLHEYGESMTYSWSGTGANALPVDVNGNPSGTESVTSTYATIQSLSRDLQNDAGQIVEQDVYTNLAGATYTQAAKQFGSIGTNYLATTIGYDWRGRRARVTTPDGTMTQTVFDGLGRVASIYKGTNNNGWTQTDPTGGGASGNNMVEVSANTYDGGGVGDSNLTASQKLSGTAIYETDYKYDFRDRLTDERGPDQIATKYTLDNLGEQTQTDTYDDLNGNFVEDAGEAIGKTTDAYDAQGDVYQSSIYQNSRSLDTAAMTSSGTTATVKLTNHGFGTGQSVTIAGATQTAYDGTFTITVVDANTFTFTLPSSTTSPATGSRITVTANKTLTTNNWYDARGNLIKSQNPSGLISKTFYDGANRITSTDTTADPTETASGTYANASTLTGDQVIEENDYYLDADGRTRIVTNWRRDGAEPSSTTGAPTADNYDHSSIAYFYDTANRLIATADYGRDGAEAGAASTDALVWNTTGHTYKDGNSNGIPDVIDHADGYDPGQSTTGSTGYDWIYTGYAYDAAGRLRFTTDNASRKAETLYDLAGRTVATVADYTGTGAVTETTPGDQNQTTDFVYDAQGRLSQQIALDPQGSGHGVQSQTTTYVYASDVDRSWVSATLYPDSTSTVAYDGTGKGTVTGTDDTSSTFDRLGRQVTSTDQRGVVHTYTYDAQGRLTTDSIGTGTLPTGVDGAVRSIAYTYDSQSRVSTVSSLNASAVVLNQVAYTYDAWGNITQDAEAHTGAVTSTTPAVQYQYADGSGTGTTAKYVRLNKTLYPANNGTTIGTFVDNYETTDIGSALNRVGYIDDGSGNHLVQYAWVGIGERVNLILHPQVANGLEMNDGSKAGHYAAFDRYNRYVKQQWQTNTGSTNFEQRFYTYDRMGNRLSMNSNPTSTGGTTNWDETYTYDGLNRLTDYKRGTFSSGTIATPKFEQTWTLDALGNWAGYTQTNSDTTLLPGIGSFSQTRTADAANEITGITGGSFASTSYDAAGNQTAGPKTGSESTQLGYVYDGWNRLVGVDANHDGDLYDAGDVKYAYDGTGRRITKFTDSTNDGTNNAGLTEEYYQDEQNQVLEVRIGTVSGGVKTVSANPKERYLWDANYIDEPAMVELDTNTDGTRDYRLWPTTDANHNVTSLLTDQGKVVEHYAYTPFGQQIILNGASNYAGTGADPDGAEWTVDSNGSDFSYGGSGFQGLRFDPETGNWYARARYESPAQGDWTQRDPFGTMYQDGMNLDSFVKNSPTRFTDPYGQWTWQASGPYISWDDANNRCIATFDYQKVPGPLDLWLPGAALVDSAGDHPATKTYPLNGVSKCNCSKDGLSKLLSGNGLSSFAFGLAGQIGLANMTAAEQALIEGLNNTDVTAGPMATDGIGSAAAAGITFGGRFVGAPDGTLVDTGTTPPGSYDQPNGGRTDVLQDEDHGAGYSHTHDPILNTAPNGQTYQNGLTQPGRPVSGADAGNIGSGAAPRSAPKGRY